MKPQKLIVAMNGIEVGTLFRDGLFSHVISVFNVMAE